MILLSLTSLDLEAGTLAARVVKPTSNLDLSRGKDIPGLAGGWEARWRREDRAEEAGEDMVVEKRALESRERREVMDEGRKEGGGGGEGEVSSRIWRVGRQGDFKLKLSSFPREV